MPKTIELICNNCSKSFQKELKEYTRQTKYGKTNFFCSRRCTGIHNIANFSEETHTSEFLNKIRLPPGQLGGSIEKYSKEERPFYNLLRKTRRRYYKENNLDVQFIKELWEKQSGRCAISNIPLNLKGTDYNTNASIDRISSDFGYLKENVQIVSTAINLAKCHSSNESALKLMRLIVEHANFSIDSKL